MGVRDTEIVLTSQSMGLPPAGHLQLPTRQASPVCFHGPTLTWRRKGQFSCVSLMAYPTNVIVFYEFFLLAGCLAAQRDCSFAHLRWVAQLRIPNAGSRRSGKELEHLSAHEALQARHI